MLRTVCETRVPISTGKVSRIRPIRRERTIALAGSPSRAGSVADIRTPTIVAEVDVAAAHQTAGQRCAGDRDPGRRRGRTSLPTISAQAISTHLRSESMMLAATWSTPIRRAASAVRPSPRTLATATAGLACGARPRPRPVAGAARARAGAWPDGAVRRRCGPGRSGARRPRPAMIGAGAGSIARS